MRILASLSLDLPTRQSAWCAMCCRTLPGDNLLARHINDNNYEPGNVDLKAPEEEDDYKLARPSGHLTCGHPLRETRATLCWRTSAKQTLMPSGLGASVVKGLVRIFNWQALVGEQFGFEMGPRAGPLLGAMTRVSRWLLVPSGKPDKLDHTRRRKSSQAVAKFAL